MTHRSRGSILLMTILVLGLASMLMITGTEYFMRYARDARSLELRLTARHMAESGITYARTTGKTRSNWISLGEGRFRLEEKNRSGDIRVIRIYGESLRGDHTAAKSVVTAEFKQTGTGLRLIRRIPETAGTGGRNAD